MGLGSLAVPQTEPGLVYIVAHSEPSIAALNPLIHTAKEEANPNAEASDQAHPRRQAVFINLYDIYNRTYVISIKPLAPASWIVDSKMRACLPSWWA